MQRVKKVEVVCSDVAEGAKGLVIALQQALQERDSAVLRIAALSAELAKRRLALFFE